ncbi:DUF1761 domain-containing protein [Demequina lignilytica]|uniref:DUF1761 domain-containing protein n=1 Tax=Demequina lignilytica TaxID=3051663 RepID=A0AAW7M202_9MICO|nr:MULTISPECIES: DUF1761 domain-containing protein [unclassified Demequina]MDN4479241.1 DUF1761 domain-containing protein [Demequina sp. SYSU T00039-1]MDN4483123.1 DUF1761 domain-containing protein [Demequina sp. SYSU T0a273]MDN4487559.1 DUF1761 domain-containing protein [Demequina sp. SYSU T00039]MDN4490971.1 DUF1761 domain-containing protein [Demequina sp. SYSU T00068]
MDWFDLGAINWIAVLVAFVVSFALGWWWYSPAGFWNLWRDKAGVTDDLMKDANMGAAFGGTVVFNVLGVILLALLMAGLGIDTWSGGLVLGALVGLIFRGGAHAIHNGFAVRSPAVTAIDTAHDTVALAVAGVILGLF